MSTWAGMTITDAAAQIAPAIRMILAKGRSVCFLESTKAIAELEQKAIVAGLNCGSIASDNIESVYKAIEEAPKDLQLLIVKGLGCFFIGESKLIVDKMSEAFLAGKAYEEHKQRFDRALRLDRKIAIVTGSAQGFGDGIAREMMSQGAYMVVADLNEEKAKQNAQELNEMYGAGSAIAVKVDVSDEESVKAMVNTCVLAYGGLDIFVSNAGVLKAGGLEEMTVKDLEFVTKINYIAFFICAKYASRVLKLEHRFNPNYTSDIIQINSKSGFEGSNRNFAYAGSKFGGIGLVQSFAKELVEDNVKVNAICPGNFLDGPLWMDPERGLYRQYLDAGKVPGAKTIEDVKRAYESKVPMNRGCFPVDVARAIYYCVEQQYETGQAVPVTGGQNMLR